MAQLTSEQRSEITEGICSRLVEARKSLGYTQRDMAEFFGITPQAWQYYEHGRDMKGSLIVQVCAVLECSPSWLLGVQEEGRHLPPESELFKALKREFAKLNNRGQQKAVDNTRDLTFVPEYRKSDVDPEGAERRAV